MLTQVQVLEQMAQRDGAFDGRDACRLMDFFEVKDWPALGMKPGDGADKHVPQPWTREAVLSRLAHDLSFAFEKALDKRGISASCMHEVVKMWLWVLEDPLQDDDRYAQYGLPLLKAVALKYDLPNEIGEDVGDEHKYSAEADYE